MPRQKIKVIVGGDVYPGDSNLSSFISGDANCIFNDLLPDFENADISIINLESPFVDEPTPIRKAGPVLGVPSNCVVGIKAAKINLVNLANNHIMDHGSKGLLNTIKVCESANIETIGAGKDITEARNLLIKEINGIRIGILAVTEHEFSIATLDRCGAYPLDLIDFVRQLRTNKENFDYLIVLLHGGNEYYPFPSPRLKDTCHFFVEMGASAVIVQHTHCPGCLEKYLNSHIVYGQGNLIFDSSRKRKSFHQGFLVQLSIGLDFSSKLEIIPYLQSFDSPGARKMGKTEKEEFLNEISKRSLSITKDSFVEKQWVKFCSSKKKEYINRIVGFNYIVKKLNRANLFVRYICNREYLIRLQNTILCEAHREVLETLLNKKLI